MKESNKNYLTKASLAGKIEPHIFEKLTSDHYETRTIPAVRCLTFGRFDIAFKLLYLELKDCDLSFAEAIYEEHIRAFSLGTFSEPGNNEKIGLDKYFESFSRTYEDIKYNGFDGSKSVVPLSLDGSIANGSHRVASSIFLEKTIECVVTEADNHVYDYRFFYGRNVSPHILDIVATKFVEYAENVHIAFLWPSAVGNEKVIEDIIPNIVYRKDVKLTPNGAHNLLSQIYYGENWLGNVENDFRGAKDKLVKCFKNFDPVRVIAFQCGGLDEAFEIKKKIRELFGVGKHSVHITDTKEESVRVARTVFNENCIEFLNHGKPNAFLSTHAKLKHFENFIKKNGVSAKEVVLDGGMVLAIFGLREASDIDYLASDKIILEREFEKIEQHDSELEYHRKRKLELIFNPEMYFYFNGLKFISLKQVYRMKLRRGEVKDISDRRLMSGLIQVNVFQYAINFLKQSFFYQKIKMERRFTAFLIKLKIYDATRDVYRFLMGKK